MLVKNTIEDHTDHISGSQKYLIDYSNLKDGLISNQKNFLNSKSLSLWYDNPIRGMPLLLPINLKEFDYNQNVESFKLSTKSICTKIFNINNEKYIGLKIFFNNGNIFTSSAKPKFEYKSIVRKISENNKNLKNDIKEIINSGKTVAAFQTRNIPHFGHEFIIEKLLNKFDYVFINPVIGPKKIGDAKNKILFYSYKYLSENYYDNRVFYKPLCANMFYGGPREALHHIQLRQNIGFSGFAVGRDHAGAENQYNEEDAIRIVNKFKSKFIIKILTQENIFFNSKTNNLTATSKSNSKDFLISISGSKFRENLKNKKIYQYARIDLQEYLQSKKEVMFY